MLQDTVLRCITLYRIFWLYLGESAGYYVLHCSSGHCVARCTILRDTEAFPAAWEQPLEPATPRQNLQLSLLAGFSRSGSQAAFSAA